MINPHWQISGTSLRPFYWKTHPLKNVFFNSVVSHRPFYWITNPIVIWRILGRHTSRFTGKLIQKKAFSRKEYFTNFVGSHRPFYWKTHPDQMLHIIYGFSHKNRMDEFSIKTICVTPQNWNFEKKLDEFSSKTACENGNSRKFSGWVFHDLPIRVKCNSRSRNRHNFFLWAIFLFSKVGNESVNQADSGHLKLSVQLPQGVSLEILFWKFDLDFEIAWDASKSLGVLFSKSANVSKKYSWIPKTSKNVKTGGT